MMAKRTWIVIVSIIILVIVIVFCIRFSTKKNETLSFEQIVGVPASDIMRVESSCGEESLDMITQFSDGLFIRYDGNLGNTAHRKLTLYDKDGNEIATVTDIGNSGIIEIEVNDSKQTYKMIDE